MSKFFIKLREDTFFINSSGSVIGDICFAVDDWYFPDKNWDDFVVILLSWLAQQIMNLYLDKNQVVEMSFMEGCFKVSLTLNNHYQCTIRFIEGEKLAGDKEIIYNTITVPFEEVKDEVRKACELLIRLKTSKILDFEENYEKLKQVYELLCRS